MIKKTKTNLKSQKGFTIIEVLIVLAIAGLILLIVFLAVPALQRNSRNTQYRTEASRVGGATQEFIVNRAGSLPSQSVSSSAGSDAREIIDLANTTDIRTLEVTAPASVSPQSPTFDRAILVPQVNCGAIGGTSVTPTLSGASPKSLSLIFAVENTNGSVNAQCVQI